MIADATTADRGAFAREFDICIIGAGPAGITLARKLGAAGRDVALMEAGGLAITEESQAVYEGEVIGQDYFPLDVSRLRFFGGTSNHWAGWCRALDPWDFAPRSWNPLSGWPITKVDLDPFRRETDDILDIPSVTEAPDLPLRQEALNFTRFQFRWSPPTRFGEKYRAEIAASDRIRLMLNANLVDLALTDDHGAVAAAAFRSFTPGDPGFTVKARVYALCCGGIENPRLLLNFRSQMPQGVGNRHDMVGRYFCEHPHFVLADMIFRAPPEFSFFAPTPEFIAANAVLNFGLRIEPAPLPATVVPAAIARSDACADPFILRLAQQFYDRKPRCDPEADRMRVAHAEPTVALEARLRIAYEQALNPDSQVRLGAATDAFGLRRAALDWRLSALDIHTMRTAALAFGGHLAEQDLARARLRDWLLSEPAVIPGTLEDEVGGKHHMGATRMADDPRHGVVDRDCRVHGLANLYVGGSSVFATSGHANPTYTIVQLALRLGDHLGRLR